MRNLINLSIRPTIALLAVVTVLVLALPATAQTEATQLNTLNVELWPDYDRPSMLVLLTGVLPGSATLPAVVTLPLPADAEIHAVASFNEAGALLSNVDYTLDNGRIRLTTPSASFRVEYYAPYESDSGEQRFTFDWLSDLAVGEMSFIVQQPIAATDFRTTPAATSSAANRGDGLTYHTLPPRPVSAGEPVTVEIVYAVDAPVLSAPPQTLPAETASTSGSTPSSESGFNPLWLLAAVAALALIGGAWYLGQRQGKATSRARKPQPTREEKPKKSNASSASPNKKNRAAARYCHSCGSPAQAGDTFCRNCGTQLKID